MPKSKVNKKVFVIPKQILLTGKLLQSISTKLAAAFVLKLFRTPYKFPRPEREQKMYAKAAKKMLLIPALQKKIQVYTWGASGKRILLIHGWAGRGTQMAGIAETLVKNGFQVVSFDATAHGDSEGKTSAMPEFIACILHLEKQYGTFDFAIGHSLGGMALLQAVVSGFKAQKIVVIGVADSILDICKQFVEKLALKEKVAYALKAKMDVLLQGDSEQLSAGVAAKSVAIPTLVIHDTHDTDVPLSWAKNVYKNLKNGKMLVTKGLGHRRVLWDTSVITSIMAFFDEE